MRKLLISFVLRANLFFWFLILSAIIPKQLYAQPDPCPCDGCEYLQLHFPYYNPGGSPPACANSNAGAPYPYYDAALEACIGSLTECNYIPINDYSAFLALLGVGLILITRNCVKPFLAFIKKQFVRKKYTQGG